MRQRDKLVAQLFKTEELEIDGEKYFIREMTAGAATEYEESLLDMSSGKPVYKLKGAKSRMVQACLFTEKGEHVFEKKDLLLVESMPKSLVEKIFDLATRVNSLDPKVTEKN